MANDTHTDPDETLPPSNVEPVAPSHRRHRRWPWVVAAIIVSPIALLALWTVIALNYSYSDGNRAGYVQKFSRKGWLCKTYEGQLAMVNLPGAMQERWDFSVRNDSIARLITHSMGQRVSLTYDQHAGLPTSCFGETQYFVTGIQMLGQ
jgi:hypothetical protein